MAGELAKQRLENAIKAYGLQLQAIFPKSRDMDPVQLCKALRRVEATAHTLAERLCDGPEMTELEAEAAQAKLLAKVDRILGFTTAGPRVFLNLDPRGYALKIDDTDMARLMAEGLALHRDWGGYGILAPDLRAQL